MAVIGCSRLWLAKGLGAAEAWFWIMGKIITLQTISSTFRADVLIPCENDGMVENQMYV